MAEAVLPMSWADMSLDPRIMEALRKMKWLTPTTVQQACIPHALKGRDLSIQSQTGSGKTGAFVVPIVQQLLTIRERTGEGAVGHPTGLILVPTIELCEQTTEATLAIAKYIKPRVAVENLCGTGAASSALVEASDVVISTTALLSKSLRNGTIKAGSLAGLRMLVVDEADMVMSMAEGSLRTIQSMLPASLQVILCSATLTDGVATIRGQLLRNPVSVTLTAEDDDDGFHEAAAGSDPAATARSTGEGESVVESRIVVRGKKAGALNQYYLVATEECHSHTLLYSLYRLQLLIGKTLIFVSEEDDTYKLQHFLQQLGISSVVYDAGLPVNVRLDVLRRFQRREVLTLICTESTLEHAERLQQSLDRPTQPSDGGKRLSSGDVDALEGESMKRRRGDADSGEASSSLHRGVDFHKVRNVILFNGIDSLSPLSLARYTHRVGRTGRAGESGMAITILTLPQAKHMIRGLREYVRSRGEILSPFKQLERSHASKLQYRVDSVLANVTRNATKRLRVATVAAELTRSSYLSNHMSEKETDVLRKIVKRSQRSVRCDKTVLDVPRYMEIRNVEEPSKFMKRVNRTRSNDATRSRGKGSGSAKGRSGRPNFHGDPVKSTAAQLKPKRQ